MVLNVADISILVKTIIASMDQQCEFHKSKINPPDLDKVLTLTPSPAVNWSRS